MPLRHRHDYAAGLHRGLRTEGTNPIPEFPVHNVIRVRAAAQPKSARFELVGTDLRSFQTLVSHVHRPVLLAEPTSSGSADASRRCRGCFPPSPASPGSGCPQLQPAAATAGRRRSLTSIRSHSASWRSEPIHPFHEREFDFGEGLARTVPVDDLGLEQADDRFGKSVVVGISNRTCRCRESLQSKRFSEFHRGVSGEFNWSTQPFVVGTIVDAVPSAGQV